MAHTWASSTHFARTRSWHGTLAPLIGEVQLSALTRAQCQAVLDALNASKLSPASVVFHMATLSGMLASAVKDGLIARNHARAMTLPRIVRTEPDLWTADQVRSFLASTAGSKHHVLWALLLATGVRIGEALALSWRDVDLDAGANRIRATVRITSSGGREVVSGTKTGTHRTIPLPPELVTLLRDHERRQQAEPGTIVDIRHHVFGNGIDGRPIAYHTVRAALKHAIQRAGLPPLDPRLRNPFRHLAATLMAEQGVHPSVAQAILGHTRPGITLARYTHLADRFSRDAVNALGVLVLRPGTTTLEGETGGSGGSV